MLQSGELQERAFTYRTGVRAPRMSVISGTKAEVPYCPKGGFLVSQRQGAGHLPPADASHGVAPEQDDISPSKHFAGG